MLNCLTLLPLLAKVKLFYGPTHAPRVPPLEIYPPQPILPQFHRLIRYTKQNLLDSPTKLKNSTRKVLQSPSRPCYYPHPPLTEPWTIDDSSSPRCGQLHVFILACRDAGVVLGRKGLICGYSSVRAPFPYQQGLDMEYVITVSTFVDNSIVWS
jgi:hypothetical protein